VRSLCARAGVVRRAQMQKRRDRSRRLLLL
jgi:hypothetical protein